MTGQEIFDGYVDTGLFVSLAMANDLASEGDRQAARSILGRMLAIDPASAAGLRDKHVPGLVELAERMRVILAELADGHVDSAARRANELLEQSPTQPHLAKERGRWRLHHHPVDASLVAMWSAICAENVARLIGDGREDRVGRCAAPDCSRLFLDESKNASRRFCSMTCQNRVKAKAFRRRAGGVG